MDHGMGLPARILFTRSVSRTKRCNVKLRAKILMGALVLAASSAQAAFPPYATRELKYPAYTNWDSKLPAIWTGWKSRFLSNGLVQGNDPSGTKMSISEGQSYGMMLSLWMGDQATFNSIWTATENTFWNSGKGWYGWKVGDGNFAGDADIDIAGALIFASALVDSGKWTNATVGGNTYKAKAIIVLKSVIANFIDQGNNYRINSWPGAGDGVRNPSYHMPGWYPIFKEFAAANNITGMDWDKAAAGAFSLLEAQTNASYGMARNFSSGTGGSPSGGTSSPNNYDMGFDAIRVPFRVATAAIWYPKVLPRALTYAQNVWKNGSSSKGVDILYPGEYTVESATLYGWKGQKGYTGDPKYEYFMTRAMWGSLAVAAMNYDEKSAAAANQIARDFGRSLSGNDYLSGEESRCEASLSTSPCYNYYAQSLGLMGALAISGRATNIWDDMKHDWVVPDTGASFTKPLTATPTTIDQYLTTAADKSTMISTVTATLSKAVPWKLHFQGRTSGSTFDTSATSSTLTFGWHSLRRSTAAMKFTGEQVDVRLIFPGCDTAKNASARATITLKPSVGIQGRAVRGEGTVRFTDGGVLLRDKALAAGDVVKASLIGLDGRTESVAEAVALSSTDNGLFLKLPVSRSTGVRVLELTLPTTERRRFLLTPNP